MARLHFLSFSLVLILVNISYLAKAGDSRNAVVPISFHLEKKTIGDPDKAFTMNIARNEHYFSKQPSFSNEDIQLIKVFKSVDKKTYGMTCFLTPNGRRKLERISAQNINSWLVCIINGKPTDYIYIDRAITDGQIVVWKNIEAEDLKQMIELKELKAQSN